MSHPDMGPVVGTIGATDNVHRFTILAMAERPLGHMDANRLLRKFDVHDAAGNRVARLDEKWKGLATELVTTADRYMLEIFSTLPDPLRTLVVMTPLAIDLMLYEGKDRPV
ncbi:phospholipid scramblase-related protein [Actinomadura sp. LOL_016]|uniref:phospholipid scramblase-related protein n=1 Tax=unclassified Actinomadura TaxID=2626254 RepID=UPI003A8109E7